ncbi:MAG TPA: dTDP-4-dehydrorhamnose reductase [Sedimentisphaerales bacterium]|nr:dTDP-4-dehydrorhamnose reductase [Sedimentisphaerales bacterium]
MGNGLVAILGGRGMLGTDLAEECARQGIGFAIYDLPEFNITDAVALNRVAEKHGAVVNCAAYTNVDRAESEEQLARAVNAEAVGKLGELAAARGSYVLHISTDFVFDGRLERPYCESDNPNPVSAYGRTKLAGEEMLRQSGCRHCILRVQWTYGRAGDNFVKKILARAAQGGPLKVVNDQYGSPTATTEAAKTICSLLAERAEGVYHYAASGYASRFDVARFIIDKRGLKVELQPCRTSDFPSPARRPLNSRFDCARIQAALGRTHEHWQGPLGRFVETL